MDTTLHALYGSAHQAQQAAKRLMESGVDQSAIQLVSAADLPSMSAQRHMGGFADTGAHEHNTERDHIGGFADTGAHEHTAERDHIGGFADTGAHEHNAERDRVGSFVNVAPARDTNAAASLIEAGLSRHDAQSAAERLAGGATLLIVRASPDRAAQVGQMLHAST